MAETSWADIREAGKVIEQWLMEEEGGQVNVFRGAEEPEDVQGQAGVQAGDQEGGQAGVAQAIATPVGAEGQEMGLPVTDYDPTRSPLHRMLDALDRDGLPKTLIREYSVNVPEKYKRHPFECITSATMLWRVMFKIGQGETFNRIMECNATDTRKFEATEEQESRVKECIEEWMAKLEDIDLVPEIEDGENSGLKNPKHPAFWSEEHEAWSATTKTDKRKEQLDKIAKKEQLKVAVTVYDLPSEELAGRNSPLSESELLNHLRSIRKPQQTLGLYEYVPLVCVAPDALGQFTEQDFVLIDEEGVVAGAKDGVLGRALCGLLIECFQRCECEEAKKRWKSSAGGGRSLKCLSITLKSAKCNKEILCLLSKMSGIESIDRNDPRGYPRTEYATLHATYRSHWVYKYLRSAEHRLVRLKNDDGDYMTCRELVARVANMVGEHAAADTMLGLFMDQGGKIFGENGYSVPISNALIGKFHVHILAYEGKILPGLADCADMKIDECLKMVQKSEVSPIARILVLESSSWSYSYVKRVAEEALAASEKQTPTVPPPSPGSPTKKARTGD